MVCVLITGIPASGKSYFAEYLSGYLNIPCISKDCIKEILFDSIGFNSREEKMQLNDAATREMFYYSKQLMKCNKVFIIENNFEKSGKQYIADLISKYNYKSVTVSLTGDYATIYERFFLRNKSKDRHVGHIVNDFYPRSLCESDYNTISFSQFVDEIKTREMDVFDIGDTHLYIDTTYISEINWDFEAMRVKKAVNSYLVRGKKDI